MAKFKCKNCGNIFEHFCDSFMDSKKIQCPKCKSHWVEINDTQINPITPYFGWGIQPVKIEPITCDLCCEEFSTCLNCGRTHKHNFIEPY